VARFRFSGRADSDLDNIVVYTLQTWGEAQTDRYLCKIEDCCQLLANNPGLGRLCDPVRPGLRRMEHGKHVIFYRVESGGILVCRILHQRMLPETQGLDLDAED